MVDLVFALVFDLHALREAERRFCVVGRPAWMPGEPCWARDGPSRRAHGAGPERGTPERSEGRTLGQGLFGSFCGCLTKGTRRKGETIISVSRKCRICTPCASCFAMHPHLCRVHIHSMCHDFLRVPPLRRVTFSKRRKSNQKGLPYHTAASPRLRGALTPALSWGHAATGHPWPIAAGAASCRATPITAPAFGLL